jgi:Tfp pilus assembly protein PilP
MRVLTIVAIGVTLVAAPGMRAQNPQTTIGAARGAASTASQGSSAPAAAPAAKSNSLSVGKPGSTKKSKKSATPDAKTVADRKPAESEQKIARRDPFESMVGRQQNQGAENKNLPPGKAGLQVSTLRLDGIVRAPNGMIAVVANPQQRTYFLREGDQLYDGKVEKISMEGVTFHEEGKDAFGKPVERQVNKRLYSSAGEQQ